MTIPDSMYDYRYEFPTAKVITTCSNCSELLTTNDEWYDINGLTLCEECLNEYLVVIEENPICNDCGESSVDTYYNVKGIVICEDCIRDYMILGEGYE